VARQPTIAGARTERCADSSPRCCSCSRLRGPRSPPTGRRRPDHHADDDDAHRRRRRKKIDVYGFHSASTAMGDDLADATGQRRHQSHRHRYVIVLTRGSAGRSRPSKTSSATRWHRLGLQLVTGTGNGPWSGPWKSSSREDAPARAGARDRAAARSALASLSQPSVSGGGRRRAAVADVHGCDKQRCVPRARRRQ